MRSGWKTSEFWTVVAAIATAVATAAVPLPPLAAVAGCVAAGAYALSRGLVKANQPPEK
jgi:hypothetical protein